MKTNEIMTGDYFRISQTGKIIKIVAVDECSGSVDFFDGDAGGALTIGVDKIEPIPLTAEILEKNGWNNDALSINFTLKGDNWSIKIEYLNEKWAIEIRNTLTPKDSYGRNDMVAFYRDWAKDVYVHELQHALRVCGIDKEIVL